MAKCHVGPGGLPARTRPRGPEAWVRAPEGVTQASCSRARVHAPAARLALHRPVPGGRRGGRGDAADPRRAGPVGTGPRGREGSTFWRNPSGRKPSGGIQRAQARAGRDRAALGSSWETAGKSAKTVETPLLNHSPCILQFTPRSTFTQSCQTAVQKARVEPRPARPPEAARGLQQEGTEAPGTRGEPIPCL